MEDECKYPPPKLKSTIGDRVVRLNLDDLDLRGLIELKRSSPVPLMSIEFPVRYPGATPPAIRSTSSILREIGRQSCLFTSEDPTIDSGETENDVNLVFKIKNDTNQVKVEQEPVEERSWTTFERKVEFHIEEISLPSSDSEEEMKDPVLETPRWRRSNGNDRYKRKRSSTSSSSDRKKDTESKKRREKDKTEGKRQARDVSPLRGSKDNNLEKKVIPLCEEIEVDKIAKLLCSSIQHLHVLKVKILLEQEDVLKVIRRCTSSFWRKQNGYYSSVAVSIINCFVGSLDNQPEEITKKKEILKALAQFNKVLFGQIKPDPDGEKATQGEGMFSALTSSLAAPGVHPELLSVLLNLGSSPLKTNKADGRNVLHQIAESCKARSHSMGGEIIKKYSDFIDLMEKSDLREILSERDSKGNTPLWTFLLVRDPPRGILQVFKNAGADFNERSSDPEHTPLSWAMGRKIGTIRKIIEFGGSLDWKGKNQRSLLHEAAKSANLDAVKFLVEEKGFNVNVEDSDGLTPLDYLITDWKGSVILPKQNYFYTGWKLKEFGGIFKTKVEGKRLIHEVAVKSKYWPWAVEFLLSLGGVAQVDEVDKNGSTALLLLCQEMKFGRGLLIDGNWNGEGLKWPSRMPERRKEVIKALLDHGADVKKENKKGKSPYSVCF